MNQNPINHQKNHDKYQIIDQITHIVQTVNTIFGRERLKE